MTPNRIANRLFMELCRYERDSDDELWYKDSLQWYEREIERQEKLAAAAIKALEGTPDNNVRSQAGRVLGNIRTGTGSQQKEAPHPEQRGLF